LAGIWVRGTSKNFETPLFISATSEVATSNLVRNLSLRSRLPKQLLGLNLVGVWARGALQNFGSLLILATVDSNDLKFVRQLGL